MIKKRILQIITLIKDIFVFIKMKMTSTPFSEKDKVILIDFKNPNVYHRYFYNFIKTLKIAGYTVAYPMNFKKFRNLRNGDVYLSLLFKDKNLINIKNIDTRKFKFHRIISDKDVSHEYYKTYFFNQNNTTDSYHIPMSFHPYMYHLDIWNQPLKECKKINSIFVFGNFDRLAYKTIHQSKFTIVDRVALLDFFSKKEHFISVKSKEQLHTIINEKKHHQSIFVEKYNVQIPLNEVRPLINNFRFFLCCPGVFAPLSHNFVEAISTGAIPIIQKNYADVIYPGLEHEKNAIIFKDLEDLEDLLENSIFSISDEKYQYMYNQIVAYYKKNIHPNQAGKTIIKNFSKKSVYLNASERSII